MQLDRIGALLFAGSTVACSSTTSDSAELTYYRDIRPIIAERCGSCHVEGGAGSVPLTSYEELRPLGDQVAAAVESGAMPPWRADPDCRTFADERRLTDAEKTAIVDWVASGMREGDPEHASPVPEPSSLDLEEVSVVARSPTAYLPTSDDDYRCLEMDVSFDVDTFLSGYQIVPDVGPLVHHVLLYLVPSTGVESMRAEDADSDAAGYPCFGSSGHGGQIMGVWLPGSQPLLFPPDSAFVIPSGSKIVAQIHYNTLHHAAEPDRTELHLSFIETAPQYRITMPVYSGFLEIAAGDPDAVFDFSAPIGEGPTRRIVGIMPHMHYLGTTIDLRRERDGEETCVVAVDDWSFDWQQFYELRPDDEIDLRPGDVIRYRCTYDNSASNQPLVDGVQPPPGPVSGGEGSLDEMCVHVVAMMEPFEATGMPDDICVGFDECDQACAPDDGGCFFACSEASGTACAGCMLPALNACEEVACQAQGEALLGCVGSSCATDITDVAGIIDCLSGACSPEFDAQWSCKQEALRSGACNGHFAACGVAF